MNYGAHPVGDKNILKFKEPDEIGNGLYTDIAYSFQNLYPILGMTISEAP